jgi:hypothetical protein
MRRIHVLAAILALLTCQVASADIISTFDTDLDGWTTDNPGTFQHMSSGGNPGGFLFLDNDEQAIAHIFAPSKFLGDLSAFDGGLISFDGNLLGDGGIFFENPDDYGVIQISGTAGTATSDLVPGGATPPLNSWATFSADLDAASWGVTQSEWNAILSDVASIRISAEALFGAEVHGFDNVRVTAVPEPSGFASLATMISLVWLRRKRQSCGRRVIHVFGLPPSVG